MLFSGRMIYVNLYILELLKLFTVCNVADNLPIMHLIIFSRYMAIVLKILSSKTIIDIFSPNCNNENFDLKIKMKLFNVCWMMTIKQLLSWQIAIF